MENESLRERFERIIHTNTNTEEDERQLQGFLWTLGIRASVTCGLVYLDGVHGPPASIQQVAAMILNKLPKEA